MEIAFRQNLPLILGRIRVEAGITQEEMASRLGVSRQSVRAYESGLSFIRADYLAIWCAACGREAGHIIGEALHPERYNRGAATQGEREALAHYVLHTASDAFVRAAFEIISRRQREAIMQLFLAYLSLPLQLAWRHARAIMEDYRFAKARGQLRGNVLPDEEILELAIVSGTAAAIEDQETYELPGEE